MQSVPDAIIVLLVFLITDFLQASFCEVKIRRLQLQIISIRRDAAAQRSQAAKFNTPATFAQCAKHERKAGALEKQAEALQKQQESIRGAWANRLPVLVKLVVTLVMAARWWGRPLPRVDPALVWPLGPWLATPHVAKFGNLGVITALPWLALCQRSSRAVVSSLLLRRLDEGALA